MLLKDREDDVIVDLGTAQKFKLMLHRQKGGWEHKSMDKLYAELKREVKELGEALNNDSSKEHIISECADVANYCAFIIEKVKDGK